MSRFKGYTAQQKEILCNLDPGQDKNTLAWQKTMAGKLANQIDNDPLNTLYNPDKINRYRKQAGLPDLEVESSFNTESVQSAFGWFTSARLFVVRLNGVLKAFGLGFIARWFDFLGISYIGEFFLDLIDIIVTTFRPLRPAEQALIKNEQASRAQIYWSRFKNKVTQDEELIPRMLNAAVWFSLNLTMFILTGGFSTITIAPAIKQIVNYLNIGGFIFDFLHEAGKGIADYFRHTKTLKVVDKELKHLKEKLRVVELDYILSKDINGVGCQKIKNKMEEIKSKIKSRLVLKKKLEEKIDLSLIPTRIYNWGITVVLGFANGMLAGVDNIVVTAARFMSFVGGSVFGGFGRRIFNKAKEVCTSLWNKAKEAIFPASEEKNKLIDDSPINGEKLIVEKNKSSGSSNTAIHNGLAKSLGSKKVIGLLQNRSRPELPASSPNPPALEHYPSESIPVRKSATRSYIKNVKPATYGKSF